MRLFCCCELQCFSSKNMDLKKVNKISQKYMDIVNGYTHRAQSLFPDDNSYFNIVDLIKHMILLYYFSLFDSDILFGTEQDKFLSFLTENGKNITKYPWKLLCKSSKDTYIKRDEFIKLVHGKGNILLLARLNGHCIIGGYTSIGWGTTVPKLVCGYNYYSDKDAFIYFFKSNDNDHEPYISNATQTTDSLPYAISDSPRHFGAFGQGYILFFTDDQCGLQAPDRTYQHNGLLQQGVCLDGTKTHYKKFTDFELEVFQVEM